MTLIPEFFIGILIAYFLGDFSFSKKVSTYIGLLGFAFITVSFLFIPESQAPGVWVLLPCLGVTLISFINMVL